MTVRSRLTGRECEMPPSPVLASLYVDGAGARVVPGGIDLDTPPEFLGAWPEKLDLLAVERVVGPLGRGSGWDDWVGTFPLVPKLGDAARLRPLDRFILGRIAHLQYVCNKPRLHLRVEEERLPISRARRVPERAISVLVSHPEDWEHRTLRGVRPSRVLARQIEDEWDLYENRVAVRLVDHLLRYVGGRVEELRRIEQMYEEGSDFADETRGSHRRAERLFELWGQYFSDNALAVELKATLIAMTRVQRDLQVLLDSPLYLEIPRRTFVAISLQNTNILVNDPHYRRVAELWREWAKRGHEAEPSRDELRKRRQAECRSFDAFARLVVVRALSDLGFSPRGPEAAGPRLSLRSSRAVVELSSAPDGVMLLSAGGESLRLVPLLGGLVRDDLAETWTQVQAHRASPAVVLLLGRPRDLHTGDEPVDRLLDLAFAGWLEPHVNLISPWSIDSVERLARVLGTWIAANTIAEYPLARTVRPDPGVALPGWLRREGGRVMAVAPARADQVAAFERDVESQRVALEREQARSRVGKPTFDPGKIHALAPLVEVARTAPALSSLSRCPICAAEGSFEARVETGVVGTWWCRCPACESEWGTRACTACKKAFPVLTPAMSQRHPGGDDPRPDWVDRYYGRDVWAEPCWRSDRADKFRCTACGACGGACSRCAVAK